MTNKKHKGDFAEYREEFLRCRGLRQHTWSFQTDFNIATGPRGKVIEFTRNLKCLACETVRKDTYRVKRNGTLEFTGREYEYSDGYQVTRTNGIAAHQARDAFILREMKSDLDRTLLNRLLSMRPDAQQQPALRVVGE